MFFFVFFWGMLVRFILIKRYIANGCMTILTANTAKVAIHTNNRANLPPPPPPPQIMRNAKAYGMHKP